MVETSRKTVPPARLSGAALLQRGFVRTKARLWCKERQEWIEQEPVLQATEQMIKPGEAMGTRFQKNAYKLEWVINDEDKESRRWGSRGYHVRKRKIPMQGGKS